MKIFVDDIRLQPPDFTLYKTAEDFLDFLVNFEGTIDVLSLDHDLGLDVMNGYDLVKKIVELNPKIDKIQFHTSNIVGYKNMYSYLLSAKKADVINNIKEIDCNRYEYIDGEIRYIYQQNKLIYHK